MSNKRKMSVDRDKIRKEMFEFFYSYGEENSIEDVPSVAVVVEKVLDLCEVDSNE